MNILIQTVYNNNNKWGFEAPVGNGNEPGWLFSMSHFL